MSSPAEQVHLIPKHDNPIQQIQEQLALITDIKINVQQLWDMIEHNKITEESIPIILKSVMHAVKVIDTPNHVKKKLVVTILNIAIDKNIQDPAAMSLKIIVPVLVDTFVEIANSKGVFKIKKKLLSCCS